MQTDIDSVTGTKPSIIHNLHAATAKNIIIIGSINNSAIIKQLITQKKISVTSISNKWEAYTIQTIKNPFKGIEHALVIAGSDRRGTAYGVFELSKQMGVSPWYWWADVPVKKKADIYVNANASVTDSPLVKYRGIFINDEAPAFSGWTKEKFGGVNSKVYVKMFELLLRLKANYLWPAMWGNAFNDDDKLNPVLADEYGIVMGTSHHEPMLRAQQEWKRYGKGAWDYTKNDTVLRAFWQKGIENMGNHESIVTIGMRGDGDMPMTRGTATDLLEKIVADQRKILEDVTKKPAAQTPQLWALYKEVQDYYDKGMRVPDDVTLLLCDDNWGNIRKLPKITDKLRTGGYGIYYHFDYVGGPRNYKWLNTNNIARVWEQMHLAYEYGVKNIWIVNVGDLKPMEFPISFWCSYAWNPKQWNANNLTNFYSQWAESQFGAAYAASIGNLLRKYAQYSARKKPELLNADTYSLTENNEWNYVLNQWKQLLADAEKVNTQVPAIYKDAFFQLVLHPVKAMENLHELYYAVAMNKKLAAQKSAAANIWADKAKQFYQNDSLISYQYNHELASGKWNHMMDQTHIGYVSWQEPRRNTMPKVEYVENGNTTSDTGLPDIARTSVPATALPNSFYQEEKIVSILAEHYTRVIHSSLVKWQTIPDIGKDWGGISTYPTNVPEQSIQKNSPHTEYDIYVSETGAVKLNIYFSPTLNFHNNEGLKYAISIDDEVPQTIILNKDDNERLWGGWVSNYCIIKTSQHHISKPGKHIVKYWMVSPAVIVQKIVADFGNTKLTYLGPSETITKTKK